MKKLILPQHTDHAGVMWHGAYLNFLEEARIKALLESGINYYDLVDKGFEMPVREINIKYLSPILKGKEIIIESIFTITNSPKIEIISYFFAHNRKLLTMSKVTIVLIKKDNFSIVKKRPVFLKEVFNKLSKGVKS